MNSGLNTGICLVYFRVFSEHYNSVIMSTIASLITSLTIVYSTVYSDADQRKHQSSASLAFVRGIHRRPVNSPHKWPVTRKMFPFDDVINEVNIVSRPVDWCVTLLMARLYYIGRVEYWESSVVYDVTNTISSYSKSGFALLLNFLLCRL